MIVFEKLWQKGTAEKPTLHNFWIGTHINLCFKLEITPKSPLYVEIGLLLITFTYSITKVR